MAKFFFFAKEQIGKVLYQIYFFAGAYVSIFQLNMCHEVVCAVSQKLKNDNLKSDEVLPKEQLIHLITDQVLSTYMGCLCFSLTIFCSSLFQPSSIIFDRLAKSGSLFEPDISNHLNEYGDAGLWTLALTYRVLEESECSS